MACVPHRLTQFFEYLHLTLRVKYTKNLAIININLQFLGLHPLSRNIIFIIPIPIQVSVHIYKHMIENNNINSHPTSSLNGLGFKLEP